MPQDLFGLVIGIKGQNLQAARKIEGVINVILDDDQSKVRVVAEVCTIGLVPRGKGPVLWGKGPVLWGLLGGSGHYMLPYSLQSAQAAAKARDMLEYASEEVRIPRDLAGTPPHLVGTPLT